MISLLKNVDKKLVAFLVVGVLLIGASAAVQLATNVQTVEAAASDYFLQIDGIAGGSTAANHKGDIQVLSWSWGVSNSSTTSTGTGMGAGKVSISSFNFMKRIDKTSPLLYKANTSGQHIPNVYLKLNSAGLTVHLTDVTVDGYGLIGNSGDSPMESVSMNFAKIEMNYSTK